MVARYEIYLFFYISMLLLTLKKERQNCEITFAKCKFIFIKWFVQLRFYTPEFILVFSIHSKILVSNIKWFNNEIDNKSSSNILKKLS